MDTPPIPACTPDHPPSGLTSLPAYWQSDAVRGLARTLEASGDTTLLPILADALEEAGCDDIGLLLHCRASMEHAPNCWALSLCLNRPPGPSPPEDRETALSAEAQFQALTGPAVQPPQWPRHGWLPVVGLWIFLCWILLVGLRLLTAKYEFTPPLRPGTREPGQPLQPEKLPRPAGETQPH